MEWRIRMYNLSDEYDHNDDDDCALRLLFPFGVARILLYWYNAHCAMEWL